MVPWYIRRGGPQNGFGTVTSQMIATAKYHARKCVGAPLVLRVPQDERDAAFVSDRITCLFETRLVCMDPPDGARQRAEDHVRLAKRSDLFRR